MVALAILLVGALVVVVLWSWLTRDARLEAGEGPLGLRSASEIVSAREALEAEDLAQLLELSNARRRSRGEPERTLEDVELGLARERRRPSA